MSNYRAKAARIREQKRNARILERLQNDFAAQLAIRDYRIAALEHQIHALVQTINCFRFPYPLPFSFFQNPLYFNFSNGQIPTVPPQPAPTNSGEDVHDPRHGHCAEAVPPPAEAVLAPEEALCGSPRTPRSPRTPSPATSPSPPPLKRKRRKKSARPC